MSPEIVGKHIDNIYRQLTGHGSAPMTEAEKEVLNSGLALAGAAVEALCSIAASQRILSGETASLDGLHDPQHGL